MHFSSSTSCSDNNVFLRLGQVLYVGRRARVQSLVVMGSYLSRAVIVGCFCSVKGLGYSWTPSQAAFGTAISATSIRQKTRAQHCTHVLGGGELPTSYRRGKGQTRMTRTDITDTEGSSLPSTWKGASAGEPSPTIATGAYPSLQFANSEKR